MTTVRKTMKTQEEEPPLSSDTNSSPPATSILQSENSQMLRPLDSKSSTSKISKNLKSSTVSILQSENSQMLRPLDSKSSTSTISKNLKSSTTSTLQSENFQMLRSLDSKSSASKISEDCKSSESAARSDQKWSSLHSYIWNDENRTQETIDTPTRPIRKFSSTRTYWSNKTEFLLASVGFSVGLSNVWHFPRLCFNNGGGTFLLIYILLMFLVGVPLLFLEMGIGQRMGLGSTGAWKNISPWIAGLGYSNLMVCCIVGSYYSALVAWCVYYLFHSFHFPLPWTLCPILKNSSDPDPECMRTSPSKYFWYRHVLKASDQIKIGGLPDDHLTLCLIGTWFIIGLSLMNGLKSTSKMLYVSVLLPYILLFGFLVWNVQLEGASFGITILLDAKMSVLYSLDVWHQTIKQILFSLGFGFGSYVAISSYMPRSNNCISDAFAVVIFNLIFSVVATVVIFALMSHMATENIKACYQRNINILINLINNGVLPATVGFPDSAQSNLSATYLVWLEGLSEKDRSLVRSHLTECDLYKEMKEIMGSSRVFLVILTSIIDRFSKPSIVAILVCFLLLNVGLSTLIGIMQGIVTPIQDTLPGPWKQTKWLTVSICMTMFLGSLTFTTPSGSYLVNLLDEHWFPLALFGIITLEIVAIAWLYGSRRFLADMITIMNRPTWPIYRWLWSYVIPLLLLILILKILSQMPMSNITYLAWNSSTSKEVIRKYPPWAEQLRTSLIIFTFLPLPVYFLYHSFQVVCSSPSAQMTSTVTNTEMRGWRNSLVGRMFAFHAATPHSVPHISCNSLITTKNDLPVQKQEKSLSTGTQNKSKKEKISNTPT